MSEQYCFPADKYLLIGKITRAHGLKGELKAIAFSGQPENFLQYSRLALVAEDGRMTAMLRLDKARIQPKHVILKLDTIETKSEADLTVGMGILLLREDLPELGDTDYYLHELDGLEVKIDGTDTILGTITTFFNNGAHDIVVVSKGDSEFLVPLIDEIIVARDAHQMIIDPPPGLLEINKDKD